MRAKPTELERVEKRIGELESHVGELETRLAENWTDMDLLASYTAGREELDGLLERWEALFAAAQAEAGGDGGGEVAEGDDPVVAAPTG